MFSNIGNTMQIAAANIKTVPLWWQKHGLSYTASGYGKKIPTDRMVSVNGRWHRVYCAIYSNSGTAYIVLNRQNVIVGLD